MSLISPKSSQKPSDPIRRGSIRRSSIVACDSEVPIALNLETEEEETEEEISCISKIIGNSGPWQKKFLFFYMVVYLISPFQNLGIVFYGARADFWCADQAQNLTEAKELGLINKCFDTCTHYEHDRSVHKSTIVNEWDLICSRSYLTSVATSSYQVGYLVSSLLIGSCSDRFGRRPTYIGMIILEIIAGYAQAFAPSIYFFIFSRFVLGIAAYGRYLTGKLLVLELVGSHKRALYSIFVEYSWYVGRVVLTATLFFFPYFRWVQAAVTTILIVALFFTHLVPESVRWQLSKGRFDEARTAILHAVEINRKNKKKINLDQTETMLEPAEIDERIQRLIDFYSKERSQRDLHSQNRHESVSRTFLKMLQVPKMLPVFLAVCYCWFTQSLTNYAISYNPAMIGSNLYVNMLMLTLSSTVCATLLYFTVERWDRTTFIRLGLSIRVLCCAALAFVFAYFPNSELRLFLSMLFSFTGSALFMVVGILTSETFPSEIRQFSVGWCSVAGRIGSIAAPFTKEVSDLTSTSTIFLIFGFLSFFALFVTRMFLETRGQEIPNTLEDCERITRQNPRSLKKVEAR